MRRIARRGPPRRSSSGGRMASDIPPCSRGRSPHVDVASSGHRGRGVHSRDPHAEEGDVDGLAKKAADALDRREGEELRKAEVAGKRGPHLATRAPTGDIEPSTSTVEYEEGVAAGAATGNQATGGRVDLMGPVTREPGNVYVCLGRRFAAGAVLVGFAALAQGGCSSNSGRGGDAKGTGGVSGSGGVASGSGGATSAGTGGAASGGTSQTGGNPSALGGTGGASTSGGTSGSGGAPATGSAAGTQASGGGSASGGAGGDA